MEKLKFVKPTKELEKDAIDFVKEFYEYNSAIEGVNGLHKYLDNYDAWLQKIEMERTQVTDDKNVPTETYFLVRDTDNKIVGMTTVRLDLNRRFRRLGGNIGGSIRPTERRKGYSKTSLYLGLLTFEKHGINEIMIDCDKNNLASKSTIESLGGILVKEEYLEDFDCIKLDYVVNVKEAIKKYAEIYENHIERNEDAFDNKITDIFYEQIVKEAQHGRVDCYFIKNIIFNLIIENEVKMQSDDLNCEGLLVPNLKITNKELFDRLLTLYVEKALSHYDKSEFEFLEDLDYMNLDSNLNSIKYNYLIKYIICSLIANMSYTDFENPIEFLQNRIDMFDNKIIDMDSDEFACVGYLNTIGANLYIKEEKSPINSETAFRLRGYLEFNDGYKLLMPEVYAGNTKDKYLVYGIQKTTKSSLDDEAGYLKQIRKGMIAKINGAPEHYFLMTMVLLSLCQDKQIEIVPFLVERWNAKRVALSKKKDMSLEEAHEYQERLQTNITNVFIRNFTKLEDVSQGIDFLAAPFELDDRLHISIQDDFMSRAPLFNEVYNKIQEYKEENREIQRN